MTKLAPQTLPPLGPRMFLLRILMGFLRMFRKREPATQKALPSNVAKLISRAEHTTSVRARTEADRLTNELTAAVERGETMIEDTCEDSHLREKIVRELRSRGLSAKVYAIRWICVRLPMDRE